MFTQVSMLAIVWRQARAQPVHWQPDNVVRTRLHRGSRFHQRGFFIKRIIYYDVLIHGKMMKEW